MDALDLGKPFREVQSWWNRSGYERQTSIAIQTIILYLQLRVELRLQTPLNAFLQRYESRF